MTAVRQLTLRQKWTWLAHWWKATTQQHHKELRPLFSPHLPPEGIAVDVGAHAGQFTKLFSGMCPQGHVYAFEPGSYALSLLRKATARRANVTIHPYGLGDVEGAATLNVPIKDSGSVGFGLSFVGDANAVPRKVMTETVNIRHLDDVVIEHAIPRVDFIKLDIEGFELRMLVGARETLKRFGPALFVEVTEHSLARCGDSAQTLSAYLQSLGYAPIGGWQENVLFVRDA